MKRYLIALTAFVLVIAGTGTTLAGGSSDASGDGFHCYLFFELPDRRFAQAMINDSIPEEVLMKAEECLVKYEIDEGGVLVQAIGNIAGSVCAPSQSEPKVCRDDGHCGAGEVCGMVAQCIPND